MDDSQTDTAAGNHPVEAPPARAGAARRARSTASALHAILVGAVCGLAWSAAFRAWMARTSWGRVSGSDRNGTFVGILGAGVIVGALTRARGVLPTDRRAPALALAPAFVAARLRHPADQ